jgi:hypothetical protein
MSAMCASVAFCTSFKKQNTLTKKSLINFKGTFTKLLHQTLNKKYKNQSANIFDIFFYSSKVHMQSVLKKQKK